MDMDEPSPSVQPVAEPDIANEEEEEYEETVTEIQRDACQDRLETQAML
jgi:hypothetical protein